MASNVTTKLAMGTAARWGRSFVVWGALMIGAVVQSCGRAGDSAAPEADGPIPSRRADIVGSISSQAGGQSQMAGWVIVLVERDSEVARVAEVDSAGLYVLRSVNLNAAHTIILCSPDYIVQSVLALPSTVDKTVRQFFRIGAKTLPRLIHKGPILQMQSTDGLTVHKDTALDADGNGVPDGASSIGLSLTRLGLRGTWGLAAEPTTTTDLDIDGTPNSSDIDIDNDGIINIIDNDDDGDAIPDISDLDANGDLVLDSQQKLGDAYFPSGIEFFAVQFESSPQTDGTTKSTLKFISKVRDDVQPLAVQVRGPLSMFNSAVVETTDTAGAPTVIAWDKRMLDDGASEDSAAGDRLFARKITLEAGRLPRANQMVFAQLVFGTADKPWFIEYPFVFPSVTVGTVTSQYDRTTRTVTLGGTPFGSIVDFVWSVVIFDANGLKVYESPLVNGATDRALAVPANILESGQPYTYHVVGQLLDRVPGYPSYLVRSKSYDITP